MELIFSPPERALSFAHATIDCVRALPGTQPVYDLTVEGQHEMFANGLLVYNCGWTPQSGEKSPDRLDALVWAVTDLLIDQEQMEVEQGVSSPYQISVI